MNYSDLPFLVKFMAPAKRAILLLLQFVRSQLLISAGPVVLSLALLTS